MSYQDDNYRDDTSKPQTDRDRYDDRYPDDDRDRYERERAGYPAQPAATPKKGCSKGCLYGAAGCGCVTVLGLIAAVAGLWLFADFFMKGMSTDPAVIRAATKEMADLTPPAGLEPKIKVDVVLAKVILYQSENGESTLSLVQIDPRFAQKGGNKNQEFGEEFRKGFGDGGQGIKQQELQVIKSDVKEMKIRGQDTKVRISEAKTPEGAEFRIIDAAFTGKAGPIILQLQLPLEKYNADEVTKFLETIK